MAAAELPAEVASARAQNGLFVKFANHTSYTPQKIKSHGSDSSSEENTFVAIVCFRFFGGCRASCPG